MPDEYITIALGTNALYLKKLPFFIPFSVGREIAIKTSRISMDVESALKAFLSLKAIYGFGKSPAPQSVAQFIYIIFITCTENAFALTTKFTIKASTFAFPVNAQQGEVILWLYNISSYIQLHMIIL